MIAYCDESILDGFCAFYIFIVHMLTITLFFAYNKEVRVFSEQSSRKVSDCD